MPLGPDAGLAGGTERDQQGVPEFQLGAGTGEELGVLRQGTRPAALDEPDPDLVQQARHGQLVGHGVADALALRAVAQGGVEDVEVEIGGHRISCGGGFGPDTKKTSRVREVCAQSEEVTAR